MHVEVFYRMHLTCGPVGLCLFCTRFTAILYNRAGIDGGMLGSPTLLELFCLGGCRLTDFVHLWSKSYAASIAGDSHQDLHELK